MKFVELKKNLSMGLKPAYLISGNDRFVCYLALNQIKKALNITMPHLNEVVLQGDSSDEDIARAASVFPFCDEHRLIQVNDFSFKSKKKEDELLKYLKNPLKENVVVFFSLGSTEALKPYLSYICEVNCDKLDQSTIIIYINDILKKSGAKMEEGAAEKLVLYCGNDMSRVNGELEKLISYAGENVITKEDISNLVCEDKEYSVFKLADYIAEGKKEMALDLVYTLTNAKSSSTFSILTPLYNNYRRALFIAINKDKTDNELATLLGVNSPYFIKMTKNQIKYFSPKKLKSIVDMLYNMDRNIKMGKIKDDVAIKTAVINILMIRG